MKTLLTLTTLALAASPLSAILLTVPFQSVNPNLAGSTTAFLGSAPFTSVILGTGIGSRPLEDLSGQSGEAATYYSTFTFTTINNPIVTSEPFVFSSIFGAGVDGFMALYVGSYNPASPVTNALIANNDTGGFIDQSSFTFGLSQSTTYVLVQTLNNGDSITGPGDVSGFVTTNITGPLGPNFDYTPPPPEGIPFGVDSTLGLVVLGAVGALRLRRNRKA